MESIGDGPGRTRVLVREGFLPEIDALFPNAEILHERGPSPGDWLPAGPEPVEPVDCLETLVCVGVTRARDLLSVFGRAHRWLCPDGRLLLLDGFAVPPLRCGYDGYQLLDYVLSVAARAGFSLEGPQLPDLPGEAGAEAKAAPQSRLLVFRRGGEGGRWRVTYQEPERISQVSALFQRVFGHEMSPALWRWKYGNGRGQGALALRDDRPVGHYGVLTRRIAYFGRPDRAAQAADVMVEQTDRGVLTRKGAFYLAAATMPEVCCVNHRIGYGFPNARAYRIAERLGLYEEVERITELCWTALRGDSISGRVVDLTDLPRERAGAIIDRLWEAMAADLRDAIVGVRDASWIRYRYVEHPEHVYRVLLVRSRWWRRPVGVAVLRLHEKRAELMDLVGSLKQLPALVRFARQVADAEGKEELFCWITRGKAMHLGTEEAAETDPDVCIPMSIHTPGPDPSEIRGKWWLMSGDTDFR